MINDLKELENLFIKIREKGEIKSLRTGPTGIGYTFEKLLGINENQNTSADFNTIELKCKLGYSKSPLRMFNMEPKRDGCVASRYIFEKYGYFNDNEYVKCKQFIRCVFKDTKYEKNETKFNLSIDYDNMRLIMKSYLNSIYVEDVCYWNLQDLQKTLKEKMSYLSIISAYEYDRSDGLYYKYLKMEFYELIGFYKFLELIDKGTIYVGFYMKEHPNKLGDISIKNHGVTFMINKNDIKQLFNFIKKI